MRNALFLGAATTLVIAGIAYFPGCSPSSINQDAGGPGECKPQITDAGVDTGLGENCPCDPASKAWAKPKSCYEGPNGTVGKGVCRSGTRTCTPDGFQTKCDGQTMPSVETCNTQDDDCNGAIDDIASDEPVITEWGDAGFECNDPGFCPPIDGGAQCYVNGRMPGLCGAGRYGCNTMGQKDCVPIFPLDPDSGMSPFHEVCNGFDDDCDNQTDNVDWAGQMCTVMYDDGGAPKGECAKGTRQCTGGVEVCQPGTPAMGDTCDGKDNNCNGKYDENGCNNGTCPCAKGQWCCVYSNNVYCAGSSQYGNPYVCYQQP